MPHVETMHFMDTTPGRGEFTAVRLEGAVVGVAFSLQDDGDIESFSMVRGVSNSLVRSRWPPRWRRVRLPAE